MGAPCPKRTPGISPPVSAPTSSAISSRRGVAGKRSGKGCGVFPGGSGRLRRHSHIGGQLSSEALNAVDQARRDGLRIALVTGRIEAELAAELPQIAERVDALVLENGAVTVIDGTTRPLSAPVDSALDDALAARGVPCRRGEVLGAVDGEHAATVAEVIGELRLDCQIVRNRAALMVLPAGVTKGTGLGAALAEMNLSAHNTVAVGDAENDLSLFALAEIGVAVADAVPSVRQHADLVLEEPGGAGVAELLTGPYLSGARRGSRRAGGSTSAPSMTEPRRSYQEVRAGSWSPEPPGRGKVTWSDSWQSNGSWLVAALLSLTPKATRPTCRS